MKYCKNCGEKSENNIKFCPNCGKSNFIESDDSNCYAPKKSFWSKAFSINGRLNRSKYFTYGLAVIGLMFLSAIPFGIMLKTPMEGFGIAIYVIILIATIISSITIKIRRFHDLNFTGWLMIPYVILLTLGNMAHTEEEILIFSVPAIIVELFLLFKKGTTGTNKYGEDPLRTK